MNGGSQFILFLRRHGPDMLFTVILFAVPPCHSFPLPACLVVWSQGALDGGLDIPHNEKRFVGYTKESGLDAEVLRKYIFGGHVSEYMAEMEEEDPEKYNRHFANYIDADLDSEGLEDLYTEVRHSKTTQAADNKAAASKDGLLCICVPAAWQCIKQGVWQQLLGWHVVRIAAMVLLSDPVAQQLLGRCTRLLRSDA